LRRVRHDVRETQMTISDYNYSSTRPVRLRDVPHWDLETEAVIVGFGACAAIEAATLGTKVVLFELAAGSGGASAMSGGDIYMGGSGGTPIQRSAGFTDDTEDMFRYLMMAGGPN